MRAAKESPDIDELASLIANATAQQSDLAVAAARQGMQLDGWRHGVRAILAQFGINIDAEKIAEDAQARFEHDAVLQQNMTHAGGRAFHFQFRIPESVRGFTSSHFHIFRKLVLGCIEVKSRSLESP